MKNSITLLDASLRDGGHLTNFHFEDSTLEKILPLLDHSGIEYIEIGYRNGSYNPIKNMGRAGLCDKNYLKLCQSLIRNAKIAVMAHPININQADLAELKACGVRLLRLGIAKNELPQALPIIKMAKQSGLELSVNFIHASCYNDSELDAVVELASKHNPDIIYFADSNGSMLPSRIKQIYDKYVDKYSIPFGFHAHDNIGLAQANALAAMSSGVRFIDASIAGMGKGIGNLKTEFFIAYLHAIHIKKYNLQDVLNAANYVRAALKIGHESLDIDEFIKGITDQK